MSNEARKKIKEMFIKQLEFLQDDLSQNRISYEQFRKEADIWEQWFNREIAKYD